jgi:D-ribose pyranase
VKKIGVLNQAISEVIAGMGHGDMLVIGDCGLPIPPGVRRIDIALTPGVPGFLETLSVILQELEVESVFIANEMETVSPKMYECVKNRLGNILINKCSHGEFKDMNQKAVAVIRTGECTPYANIILSSGVNF